MTGGVGAYVSTNIKSLENDKLPVRLKIRDSADLWIDVQYPRKRNKYTISAIYRHPCNNAKTFFDALDEKMSSLNQKRTKAVILKNINLDLNSTTATSLVSDYPDIAKSNAFSNLTDKPTRVTPNTQTIIDHVLTNDRLVKVFSHWEFWYGRICLYQHLRGIAKKCGYKQTADVDKSL